MSPEIRTESTVHETTTRERVAAMALHEEVATLAGEPSSPNDPAAFLSLVSLTLSDRVSTLQTMAESETWDPPSEVTNALRDVADYGESINSRAEDNTRVNHVPVVLLGTEYAVNLRAVQHLRNKYVGSMPEAVEADFRAIERLLESLAVVRQFYNTIALQQEFAELSRMIVYTGLIALVAASTRLNGWGPNDIG